MAKMPEATKTRLQKERAAANLHKQMTKPAEKGNLNQTAMLLAQAALRHARRSRNLAEIEACKEAIEFFEAHPTTCYITPAQREELYENIRMGLPARKAVLIAGIDWSTFHTWRRLGGHREYFAGPQGRVRYTQAPEPFRSFLIGLYKAEAEAQKLALTKLMTLPDTAALKFFLERRFPEEWGQRNPEPVQQAQQTQSTVNIVIPDNGRGGVQVYPGGDQNAQSSTTALGSNGTIKDEDDVDGPTMNLFMDDMSGDIDAEYEVIEHDDGEHEAELLAAQEALARMIEKAERHASGSEEMASPPKSQRTKKRTAV